MYRHDMEEVNFLEKTIAATVLWQSRFNYLSMIITYIVEVGLGGLGHPGGPGLAVHLTVLQTHLL